MVGDREKVLAAGAEGYIEKPINPETFVAEVERFLRSPGEGGCTMIRVLIVDDKPENLYLLRALLQGHGCVVDEARHGAEALTKARRGTAPPDHLRPVDAGHGRLYAPASVEGRRAAPDDPLRCLYRHIYRAQGRTLSAGPWCGRFHHQTRRAGTVHGPHRGSPGEEELAANCRVTRPRKVDETDLLKEYSEVLIHKLEKKVLQLEQVNRDLQEDIARRQQVEAELLEARQDWEDIFQATGNCIIIMDRGHRIVAANKKCIEVTGKSLDELLDAKCYKVFHTNGKLPKVCPMEALLESGSTETEEMEMEALGGYYLVSCTPVLDQEGNIRKVIHAATDITRRKKAEEALRESEERHRNLVEHLPQRIFIKDRNSVYASCNRNYAADLGISPEQIVGRDDFDFHPPELAQAYRADDQACMDSGMVKDFEEPYQLHGQDRWAHTIKVPYKKQRRTSRWGAWDLRRHHRAQAS